MRPSRAATRSWKSATRTGRHSPATSSDLCAKIGGARAPEIVHKSQKAGLAVRRLREREHLGGPHPEDVGDVAVSALVSVAEAVVVRCEIPFTAVLFVNRIGEPGQ